MEGRFQFDFQWICMSRPVGESWYGDTFSGLSWGDRAISWRGLKMKCPSGLCRNVIIDIYSSKITSLCTNKRTYIKGAQNGSLTIKTESRIYKQKSYLSLLFVFNFIFVIFQGWILQRCNFTLAESTFFKHSEGYFTTARYSVFLILNWTQHWLLVIRKVLLYFLSFLSYKLFSVVFLIISICGGKQDYNIWGSSL